MPNESGFSKTAANGQAANAGQSVGGTQTGAAISSEVHSFLDDVEVLIQQVSTLGGEDLVGLRNKINQRLAAARTAAEKLGGQVASQARQAVSGTDSYVHRRPWQAIGIGAAFGMLLGLVLARRR